MYPIKIRSEDKLKPSKLHQRAIEVVKQCFPTTRILQEVSVKIDTRQTLYLDIYLISMGIVIEVNGRQHFERVAHFQSQQQFLMQRAHDLTKSNWAELNELRLVNLNYDESDEEWRVKLTGDDAG